jgi:hypothetical protein
VTVIDLARIAEYRLRAEDCRKRALETKFLDLKRQREDLARQYDEFAEGRAARKIARRLDYLSNPVNDTERLRHDPAMRGKSAARRRSTCTLGDSLHQKVNGVLDAGLAKLFGL